MSTAVSTNAVTAVATSWAQDVTQGVEFHLQPMRYTLAPGGSPYFNNTLGGEPVASLDVIILMTRVARFAYPEATSTKQPPFCMSLDGGIHGSPRDTPYTPPMLLQAGAPLCATCPLNQWGSRTSATGKKVRACSEKRAMLMIPAVQIEEPDDPAAVLARFGNGARFAAALAAMGKADARRAAANIWQPNPDNDLPLLLNAPATSLKPVDTYLSALMYGAQVNPVTRAAQVKAPAYALATRLTVTRVTGGANEYGTLTPQALGWVDPLHLPGLAAMRAGYGAMLGAVLEDAEIADAPANDDNDIPF